MKRFFLAMALAIQAVPAYAEDVRLCHTVGSETAAVLVAEHKGYFREEGLNIIEERVTTGKLCQDSLLAGKADFGMVGDGPLAYIGFEKHPLRILAQTVADPELAVFARTDHGIHQTSDLRGKRIGYLPGTISYFYLARLLDQEKLKTEEVTLVPLQPPAMTQALVGGMIDAFVMIDQYGAQSKKQMGDKVIRLRTPDLYNFLMLLVTTEEIATTHKETVENKLRALIRAEDEMRQHPEDTIATIAQQSPVDPVHLTQVWSEFDNHIRLDSHLANVLATDASYILRDDENRRGETMPDYTKMIDATAFLAVSPDRVTLE